MNAPPPYQLRLPQAVAQQVRDGNCQFVITGARGWMGRATLDLLESALGGEMRSRVAAFGSSRGVVRALAGTEIPVLDLADAGRLARRPTLLMHYAYLTKDRLASMSAKEYRDQNARIRDAVLSWFGMVEIAGVFLPSSGAVYAALGSAEDRDGRGAYGRDKLEDELQFASACRQRSARLLVARVFSLSGPHINKHDAYVLAAIILSILRGEPVVLRAQRPVYRSFVAVADLVSLAIAWLLSDNRPEQLTIDAASEEIMELGELATRAVAILGAHGTRIQRPAVDPRDPDRYVGDSKALAGLASALGLHLGSIDQQISDTAAFLAKATVAIKHE